MLRANSNPCNATHSWMLGAFLEQSGVTNWMASNASPLNTEDGRSILGSAHEEGSEQRWEQRAVTIGAESEASFDFQDSHSDRTSVLPTRTMSKTSKMSPGVKNDPEAPPRPRMEPCPEQRQVGETLDQATSARIEEKVREAVSMMWTSPKDSAVQMTGISMILDLCNRTARRASSTDSHHDKHVLQVAELMVLEQVNHTLEIIRGYGLVVASLRDHMLVGSVQSQGMQLLLAVLGRAEESARLAICVGDLLRVGILQVLTTSMVVHEQDLDLQAIAFELLALLLLHKPALVVGYMTTDILAYICMQMRAAPWCEALQYNTIKLLLGFQGKLEFSPDRTCEAMHLVFGALGVHMYALKVQQVGWAFMRALPDNGDTSDNWILVGQEIGRRECLDLLSRVVRIHQEDHEFMTLGKRVLKAWLNVELLMKSRKKTGWLLEMAHCATAGGLVDIAGELYGRAFANIDEQDHAKKSEFHASRAESAVSWARIETESCQEAACRECGEHYRTDKCKGWKAIKLAEEDAGICTEQVPTWSVGFHRLGCAFLEGGNYEDAVENFTRALELETESAVRRDTITMDLHTALEKLEARFNTQIPPFPATGSTNTQ